MTSADNTVIAAPKRPIITLKKSAPASMGTGLFNGLGIPAAARAQHKNAAPADVRAAPAASTSPRAPAGPTDAPTPWRRLSAIEKLLDLFDLEGTEPPFLPRQPYCIGVRDQVLADPRRKAGVTDKQVCHALAWVCGSGAYLHAVIDGRPRHDLYGVPGALPTPAEREHAELRLAGMKQPKAQKPAQAVAAVAGQSDHTKPAIVAQRGRTRATEASTTGKPITSIAKTRKS